MPRVLITGVLGMIGQALCKKLLQSGEYAVDGIDIKTKPDENMLSGLRYIKADIRDGESIEKIVTIGNYDFIVHLAAISRVVEGERDKRKCIQTNYIGTKNFVDSIKEKSPATHLIFASSREVYGEQEVLPVPETAELLPLNVYGFYKLWAEKYVREQLSRNTILRFCNVYGSIHDIPGRVIPNFIRRSLSGEQLVIEGGRQVIDFTYIDDTIWAIERCLKLIPSGSIDREAITISPGEGHTLQDIVGIIGRSLGHKIKTIVNPERDYDVQRFIADPSKRKKLLGDRTFVSLEDGIRRTIELYKEHHLY